MKLAGFLFIVAGVFALIFPLTTGIAIEVFFGIALAAAGAVHMFDSYRNRAIRYRTGHLGLAGAFILIGLLLLLLPMTGMAIFTLLLALAFIAQGVAQLYYGLMLNTSNRMLMLGSGVLGVIVGVLVFAHWPSSAHWLVGVMAGVNMIVLGVTLVTIHIQSDARDADVIEG